MESDAAMTEDLIAYNIIPLDTPTTTNAIVSLPEVSGLVWLISGTCIIFGGNLFPVEFIFRFKLASVSALKYFRGLPKLPENLPIPAKRNADMLDFLQYVFGFQVCIGLLVWVWLCLKLFQL